MEPVPGSESTATQSPSWANLERFQELFPGVVQDGVLDAGRLGEALGIDVSGLKDGKERFGLMWAGRQKAVDALQAPSFASLVPDIARSNAWEIAENVFIEGDNLEVLKLMQKAYNDAFDLIYIDPPYNTGEDFVYKDDFSDPKRHYLEVTGQIDAAGNRLVANTELSGRKHSNWLSMLLPRLALGRNLLSQDGIICVSIDDNEMHNLRSLMDEVFGPECFVGVIKRRASRKTTFLSKTMADMCDYVVIYTRSELSKPLSAGQVSDGSRPVVQSGNKRSVRVIRAGTPANCPDAEVGPGLHGQVNLLQSLIVKDGKVQSDLTVEGPWRVNQDILDQTVFVTRSMGFRRNLLAEELEKSKLLNDLLDDPSCYNEAGSEEIERLIGKGMFDYPKPVGLVKHLLRAIGKPDAKVLDYFAGSGTTGQAVSELNDEDGGDRTYVLVTLDEKVDDATVAGRAGFTKISDITLARLRAVMDKSPDAARRGLRMYVLGASSFDFAADDGVEDEHVFLDKTLLEGATDESVLAQLSLGLGVRLNVTPEEWTVDDQVIGLVFGTTAIVLRDEEKLLASLSQRPSELAVIACLEDSFAGKDDLKANLYFACKKANITFKTF